MKKKLSLLLAPLAAFTLTATLVGCGSMLEKVVKKPKVELDRVDLTDTNLTSTTMVFVFEIDNPNGFDLNVDEITYKVHLADKEFASTKISDATKIPANGKSFVRIPLPVSYAKLWGGLGQLFNRQAVTYKIEGDAKLGPLKIPFNEDGKISFQ